MRFFFDNNLAPKLARGLNLFATPEHEIIHLKDHFSANTEDAIWMRSLTGDFQWVIVTADWRISRNPHEVEAWKQAGHTVFFLKPGWLDLGFWEQAWKFTKCFPDIVERARHARKGDGFSVTLKGKIE